VAEKRRANVPHGARLARAYVLHAAIALLTTALNWLPVGRPGGPPRPAWLACISTTGLINLFAPKSLVSGRDDRW